MSDSDIRYGYYNHCLNCGIIINKQKTFCCNKCKKEYLDKVNNRLNSKRHSEAEMHSAIMFNMKQKNNKNKDSMMYMTQSDEEKCIMEFIQKWVKLKYGKGIKIL